jgi:hypothetical protein
VNAKLEKFNEFNQEKVDGDRRFAPRAATLTTTIHPQLASKSHRRAFISKGGGSAWKGAVKDDGSGSELSDMDADLDLEMKSIPLASVEQDTGGRAARGGGLRR